MEENSPSVLEGEVVSLSLTDDHLADVDHGPMGQHLPSIIGSTAKGRVSVMVFDLDKVQQGDALKRPRVSRN